MESLNPMEMSLSLKRVEMHEMKRNIVGGDEGMKSNAEIWMNVEQDLWAWWKDPWELQVNGVEEGRIHLPEKTSDSTRERSTFKGWQQQDDWLTRVEAE